MLWNKYLVENSSVWPGQMTRLYEEANE